jgi:hypothetical protein
VNLLMLVIGATSLTLAPGPSLTVRQAEMSPRQARSGGFVTLTYVFANERDAPPVRQARRSPAFGGATLSDPAAVEP